MSGSDLKSSRASDCAERSAPRNRTSFAGKWEQELHTNEIGRVICVLLILHIAENICRVGDKLRTMQKRLSGEG